MIWIYLYSDLDVAVFVFLYGRNEVEGKVHIFGNAIGHEVEGVVWWYECYCSFFIEFRQPNALMKLYIINTDPLIPFLVLPLTINQTLKNIPSWISLHQQLIIHSQLTLRHAR